jgi:hypothetical protein
LKEGASEELVREFAEAVAKALNSQVVLQQVDPTIVANEEEYIRFFSRLGQGGTRLSDDELTYSIIKQQYPGIHDRMNEIMDRTGRLAGELDLVLASLRVAKTKAPWENAKDWEVVNRPGPAFVSRLKDMELKPVLSEFLTMVLPEDQPATLEKALIQVRGALSHDARLHRQGLPAMLLARLPRELVDVLILFTVKRGVDEGWHEYVRDILRAFVLYWLLFVSNDANAAWRAFESVREKDWTFAEGPIRGLIGSYETEGEAYLTPRSDALSDLRNEVEERGHLLCSWTERFRAADRRSERKPGDALHVLSTDREQCRRALMWLQRDYIVEQWPDYDPTSDRDEDLPVDLDHIIPYNIFSFDWRQRATRLHAEAVSDNFYSERGIVGNSMGNFRWLAASDNRARGK